MSAESLGWDAFTKRLERTRASEPIVQPLRLVKRPVFLIEETDQIVVEDSESRERNLGVRVRNVGCEEALLQIEVQTATGARVGALHSLEGPIQPGEVAVRPVYLDPEQWRILREGGHLQVGPSIFPNERRRIRLGADPFANLTEIVWEVPDPFVASFRLPEKPPHELSNVEVEWRSANGKTQIAKMIREGREAAISLVLPLEAIHYRFSREGKKFSDPHHGTTARQGSELWSLLQPEQLSKMWTLRNTGPRKIEGHVRVEPKGFLRVEPDWIEAAPGELVALQIFLEREVQEKLREGPAIVKIVLLSSPGGVAPAGTSKVMLIYKLVRSRYSGAIVSLEPPFTAKLTIKTDDSGRKGVHIAIKNTGLSAAHLALQVDDKRTGKVVIPPALDGDATRPLFFPISPEVWRLAEERNLQADLVSLNSVAWKGDNWWLQLVISKDLEESSTIESKIAKCQLEWVPIPAGQGAGFAKLVFKNSSDEPITLTTLTTWRNGVAEATRHLNVRVDAGSEKVLDLRKDRRWWFRWWPLRLVSNLRFEIAGRPGSKESNFLTVT